jgi:hypothetical protein
VRLSAELLGRGPMAFEPFWARSAHVMQFRPVAMDQAAENSPNDGEDMHTPNSPKLVPNVVTDPCFGRLEGCYAAGM